MLGYYRLLLAIVVLMAHVGNFVTDGVSRAMVTAFFIVSGYLMGLTLEKNYGLNPLPFYWNRFLRLYPLHTLVALSVFILAPAFAVEKLQGADDSARLMSFLESLTLSFTSHGILVAPAWTLTYEIFFYLLAPLIFRLRWLGILIYAAVGIGGTLYYNEPSSLIQPFALTSGNPVAIYASFIAFAFGGAMFLIRSRLTFTALTERNLQLAGVALIVLMAASLNRFFIVDIRAFDAAYGPWMALTVYLSSALMLLGWPRRESSLGKLAGDLCYPVYIIHWPIINVFMATSQPSREVAQFVSHIIPHGDTAYVVAVTLAISLGIGLLWLKFEKRFIHRLRRQKAAV